MATMTDPDAKAVLDFWFGAEGSAEHGQVRAEWFRKDAAFDALIAQRFGPLVNATLAGGLPGGGLPPDVRAHPRADVRLAHVVVLDQFTRNIFRDTARAFAGDAQALAAARALVADGADAALRPEQRVFAYLPFEHAEDLAMQDESVRLYTALAAEAPQLASMLDYAHKHRAVIVRFGRFPHRNEWLGRASTAEELDFLQQPGSRF